MAVAEDMDKMEERVKAGYEAFNRGDFDSAAEYYHPDIVWHRVSAIEAPLIGREAVRRTWTPRSSPSSARRSSRRRSSGTASWCGAVFRIKGAGSGIEMSDDAWHL